MPSLGIYFRKPHYSSKYLDLVADTCGWILVSAVPFTSTILNKSLGLLKMSRLPGTSTFVLSHLSESQNAVWVLSTSLHYAFRLILPSVLPLTQWPSTAVKAAQHGGWELEPSTLVWIPSLAVRPGASYLATLFHRGKCFCVCMRYKASCGN